MASLRELTKVNNKHKSILFGYVREKEKELSLANVPAMIFHFCLLHYSHSEYFEK